MKCRLIIFFLIFNFSCIGQSDYAIGLIPAMNLSKKIDASTRLKASLQTRQEFFDSSQEPTFQHKNVLTDMSLFYSRRFKADYSLNLGYQIRFRNGSIFQRISQHLNFVQSVYKARIGHRLGFDQTFVKGGEPVFRGRYRIVLEKPLSGEQVDPEEFYFKIGTEIVAAFTKTSEDFEWRLIPQLGYEFNANNKIELGIDSRFKSIFTNDYNRVYWLTLSWFRSI